MNELTVQHLFDWTDQNVLITGAGGSIGSAIAHAFAAHGANLVLIDKNPDSVTNLKEIVEGYGRRCLTYGVDITSASDVRAMTDDIVKSWGRIDVLINHAGMNIRQPAIDYPLEAWDKVLDVNLKGMFIVAQAVGRVMMEQKHGRIINTASVSAVRGHKNLVAYAASKGGVAQMTKVLAHEWAAYGITVNAVGPGYIYTQQTNDLLSDDASRQAILKRIPAGRIGETTDVVGAYLFLASPASRYVTGQTLFVDGGRLVD